MMSKSTFTWSNLDCSILVGLALDLRLKGDPSEALEKEYGRKPNAEFIRDAWPTLLKIWFPHDQEALASLAERLREKGLGDTRIESPLSYIKSCRNTSNLREACIQLFISKGERQATNSTEKQTSPGTRHEKSDDLAAHSPEVMTRERRETPKEGKPGQVDNPNSKDELSDAELGFAITLLTPDIEEALLKLGFINEDREWISADRSSEGLKSALAMANQANASSGAEITTHRAYGREGESRTIQPLSAPIISQEQQLKKSPDGSAQAPPRRRIRWGRHTGPLIIVGALFAVTLSSGLVGFVLLVFVGLPIALYSIYKDLDEQKQRVRPAAMKAPTDTSSSITKAFAEKPQVLASSQECTELPSFDYSPRQGKTPDTEEWAMANMEIILNYAHDASLYYLALKATQYGKGNGSRSGEIDVIWGAILLMAAEQDKEMAKCLQIAEQAVKRVVFPKLVQEGFCRDHPNGELELAEGVPEVEDFSFANTDDADVEIEGIIFPLLTNFSPDQIHRFAANKKEWEKKYSSGAKNWSKIVTHSKLLLESRVIGSQAETGAWLYIAYPEEPKQSKQQMAPEPVKSTDKSKTLSKEDQGMLDVWKMVKPAEAVDLKFILVDSEGRFAGEFTTDDQHGDRYFTVTENSQGSWSMASNLISNDPAKLSKSAKAGLALYQETCSKASYRFDSGSTKIMVQDIDANQETSNIGQPQLGVALTGADLIQRVKELGDMPPQSLAKACGYLTRLKGAEVADTEAFYNALFDAHSSQNS